MRGVRKAPIVRYGGEPLSSAHKASLESEHSASSRRCQRFDQARQCVHVVPQGRQGRQGSPLTVSAGPLQGVVKSYDPVSGVGTIICDTDLNDYEFTRSALVGSVFRSLRQGQRVVFDLDGGSLAVRLRMGSEADMGTPGFEQPHPDNVQHPQGGTEG